MDGKREESAEMKSKYILDSVLRFCYLLCVILSSSQKNPMNVCRFSQSPAEWQA